MRLSIEMDPRQIPSVLSQFLAVIGDGPWRKRFKALREQIDANPLLGSFIAERFPLELALGDLLQDAETRGAFSVNLVVPAQYRLLGFVAIVAMVYDQSSARAKRRIAGTLRDALNSQLGLAPFHHEVATATHLVGRGFDVEFADLETGGGFDFLARREDVELEVECKTVSGDRGRQIHRRHMIELARQMGTVLKDSLRRIRGGLFVSILLPSRLQADTRQHRAIADQLALALRSAASVPGPDPCDVNVEAFDLRGTPFGCAENAPAPEDAVRGFVAERFGKENPHVFVLYRPGQSAVIIIVESRRPDAVLRGVMDELEEAAETQLTGTRVGILAVQFLDLTADDLLTLAHADSTDPARAPGLQLATNWLLNSPARRHIHTVAYRSHGALFYARGETSGVRAQAVQEHGPTYSFRNPNHPMADDPRYRVFGMDVLAEAKG